MTYFLVCTLLKTVFITFTKPTHTCTLTQKSSLSHLILRVALSLVINELCRRIKKRMQIDQLDKEEEEEEEKERKK